MFVQLLLLLARCFPLSPRQVLSMSRFQIQSIFLQTFWDSHLLQETHICKLQFSS